MGKFDKFIGKLEFKVAGEEFVIDFRVKDRIALAAVYDSKGNEAKYSAMADFCTVLIMKNYPNETKEAVESFLTSNMDVFASELMISANITKREDYEKAREEVKKQMLP